MHRLIEFYSAFFLSLCSPWFCDSILCLLRSHSISSCLLWAFSLLSSHMMHVATLRLIDHFVWRLVRLRHMIHWNILSATQTIHFILACWSAVSCIAWHKLSRRRSSFTWRKSSLTTISKGWRRPMLLFIFSWHLAGVLRQSSLQVISIVQHRVARCQVILFHCLRTIYHLLLSQHVVRSSGCLLLKHTIPASHLRPVLTCSWSVRSVLSSWQQLLRLSYRCFRVLNLISTQRSCQLLSRSTILRLLYLAIILKLVHLRLTLHVRRVSLIHRLLSDWQLILVHCRLLCSTTLTVSTGTWYAILLEVLRFHQLLTLILLHPNATLLLARTLAHCEVRLLLIHNWTFLALCECALRWWRWPCSL